MPMDLKGLMAPRVALEDRVVTMTTLVKTVPVARTTVELPELKEMQAQEEQTRPTPLRTEAEIFQLPRQPSLPLKTRILMQTGPSVIM